ncbi:hypothetical protein [Paraburkholderia sp. GAS334]|jgi:hypothetical protein|uniref:hypothetical protein n=1 Tax=Paraburkholderia sp. GAS334 TaxID=3035131 RepID=UPI003D1F5147
MRDKKAQYGQQIASLKLSGNQDLLPVKTTFKTIPIGKKTRKALSGGRYNLKHFVTALAGLFAHNALQRFQHGCG